MGEKSSISHLLANRSLDLLVLGIFLSPGCGMRAGVLTPLFAFGIMQLLKPQLNEWCLGKYTTMATSSCVYNLPRVENKRYCLVRLSSFGGWPESQDLAGCPPSSDCFGQTNILS